MSTYSFLMSTGLQWKLTKLKLQDDEGNSPFHSIHVDTFIISLFNTTSKLSLFHTTTPGRQRVFLQNNWTSLQNIWAHQLPPLEEDEGNPLSRAAHDDLLRQGLALVPLDVNLQDHLLGLYCCLVENGNNSSGRFMLSLSLFLCVR